jgi:hypothetical protein
MTTIDDILGRKQANRMTFWIPLDNDLAEAYREAETNFNAANSFATVRGDDQGAQRRADEASDVLASAKVALREASVKFVLQAVGRERYEQLVLDNPATREQQRKARDLRQDVPDFNEDTFPQALVAACLVEPELSEEDVHRLWKSDQFSVAEIRMIVQNAILVNQNWRVVDLGKE